MRKLVMIVVLLTAGSTAANAAVITAAGIFGPDAPVTGYTSPGAAWNFNFITSDLPVVLSSTQDAFTILVDPLIYTLSGNSAAVPGFRATFYDAAVGGGFDIASPDGKFQAFFFGPQVFAGPIGTPVFVASDYVPSSGFFYANNMKFGSGEVASESVHVLGGVVRSPEPMTIALLGLGLAGLALRRRTAAHG